MTKGRPKDNVRCVVVDTNVLAVAQDMHGDASDACRAACAALIGRIQEGRYIVALDTETSGEAILAEYIKRLRGTGQSGISTKLVQKLIRNKRNASLCRPVEITPSGANSGSYDEIPAALRDFDNDDHKWFAVAVAEGNRPRIYQALDQAWWRRRHDIADARIDVGFLCELDLPDD
ncbi:MAG TPA: hypothetical protein VFS37_09180 [Conexibacter sp.]|nr:hypothetical protein [Conexibacter sp.]